MSEPTSMTLVSEQLRLLSSIALGREIGKHESIQAVNKELTKLLKKTTKEEHDNQIEN